jgi:hypothetical protein
MHTEAMTSRRKHRLLLVEFAVIALLAPIVFLVLTFPARLLWIPFLLITEVAGLPASWSTAPWFCLCAALALLGLHRLAGGLALSAPQRNVATLATWAWAVLPNAALLLLLAQAD